MPQAAGRDARCRARIGDYTDFYTGIHHATDGRQAVPPRQPAAAQLQVGADRLPRPRVVDRRQRRRRSRGRSGQTHAAGRRERRRFGPCQRLDYELELGVFVGAGNALGEPIADRARPRTHIVRHRACSTTGRRATSRPGSTSRSGPFLAKNFATTISPWIVTLRGAGAVPRAASTRPAGDPQPLPYLDSPRNRERGAIDIALRGAAADRGDARRRACRRSALRRSNFRDAYWTRGAAARPPQQRTAATCSPATCSAPARSRARSRGRAARCWSCRPAASSRSRCPAARRAPSCEDGDTVILRALLRARRRAAHRLRRVPRHGAAGGRRRAHPGTIRAFRALHPRIAPR